MKRRYFTYLGILFSLFFLSCSSEDVVDSVVPDYTWEEEIVDGPSVTISPFTPGDELTRSSLVYRTQKMVFGWSLGDMVGLFPTAKVLAEGESTDGWLDPSVDGNKHPDYDEGTNNIWRANPATSQQRKFAASTTTSQTARLFNNDPEFEWDEVGRWTAYFPYKNNEETYDGRAFSFKNQIQEGLVDISAFRKGKNGQPAGEDNPSYTASEERASKHLGGVDCLISPEMAWNGSRINFQMRHVGAVLRMYLKAPEEDLVVTKLEIICDKKIFYEEGKFSLKSHSYKEGEEDFGVDFDRTSACCQITPVPVGTPTNNITLNFYDDSSHEKAVSVYDPADQYKRYIVAYIMTYPVVYNPATDGNLFAYVTAYKKDDASKKEYHFISKPLNPVDGVDMKSGHYYQLTSSTHVEDGLYPIELTATLLPWQDIVSGSINLGDE